MKLATTCAVVLLLAACSDDDADPKPDAGEEACTNPNLAALKQSEKRWKELAADGGDTYWYEHENCVINSPDGHTYTIQVEADKASSVGHKAIDRGDCDMTLNALESFDGAFEKLYSECRKLLERECDAKFATDDKGVIRTCQWENTKGCADNCGEGVHILRWDFGTAP